MNDVADLVALVRDELGLAVTVADAGRDLDELPGWDSMHLLWLVSLIEARTGRSLNVVDLIEAPNLESVYVLTAGG